MPTDLAVAPTDLPAGIILPGAVYRLDAFLATVGWGRAALRRARRNGLRVVRDGRTAFVLGDDFISYLRERNCQEAIQ
jgi:hypothetical protein